MRTYTRKLSNCKLLNLLKEREESYFNKIDLIVNSFTHINNMSKSEFLVKIFDITLKLIPEAEKASLYELIGDKYVPVFSKGYDFKILQKLSFNKNDAFIDFDCSYASSIDAYEVYIEKRDESKFDEEILDAFKELGTFSNFTSLYAPIQVNGLNVGLICLERFNGKGYSKTAKKVLKFYAQIISNFYTQKVIKDKEIRMSNDVVNALVSAIEVKDRYTEGHSQRVRALSLDIAEKFMLTKEEMIEISTAALLHDVGKIGIPTGILNKPGKLNTDEYNIIKQHPLHTKTILKEISGFTRIADFAYYHHERYDGKGYPEGLKGNETPFISQIIQVADAFDAMTSVRAYREALSINEALDIIKNEMGKQFNPEIAKVAIQLFSK